MPRRSEPKPSPERSEPAPRIEPRAPSPTEELRARVAHAKRDILGFPTDSVPHVTEDQFTWLSHRLSVESDEEATDLTGYTPEQVAAWKEDPHFVVLYETAQNDPRAGFRLLGESLLPKALRTIASMLASDSVKAQERGLQYLLRTQGMLIDKPPTIDPDAIGKLLDSLRETKPVTVLDIRPIER